MQIAETNSAPRGKRPTFLTVICILSFISIGLGILDNSYGLITGPSSKKELKEAMAFHDSQMEKLKAQGMDSWEPTMNKMKVLTKVLNQKFYPYIALSMLIYAIGLAGVIQMFRGLKIGFHLYIIYSILSVCDYYFFLSPSTIPTFIIIWSAIFSGIFIAMYAANLKWMR